jgi:predicted AlkP superfamily phosphohydrolase/phosphomutase
MAGKLVVIGLDGVPWRVLDKVIEEGYAPNLKRITPQSSQ